MTLKNIKQEGFTIVELLIVIVVIGILAAITIVAYGNITSQARATAAQDLAANAVNTAQNIVSLDGTYPTAITGTWTDSDGTVSFDVTDVTGKLLWSTAAPAAGVVNLTHSCAGAGVVDGVIARWLDASGATQTKSYGDTTTPTAAAC